MPSFDFLGLAVLDSPSGGAPHAAVQELDATAKRPTRRERGVFLQPRLPIGRGDFAFS